MLDLRDVLSQGSYEDSYFFYLVDISHMIVKIVKASIPTVHWDLAHETDQRSGRHFVESDNFFGKSRLPLKQDKQNSNHITIDIEQDENISNIMTTKHTKYY